MLFYENKNVVAHGAFQGAMTDASGGKFWSGFAAGALSSIASSAWSGGDTNTTGFAKENNWAYGAKTITHAGLGEGLGNAGMVAFSTVVGGGAAALTGGNFWVGAATGLVVSVCNHLAHPMEDGDPPSKKAPNLKKANEFYNKNKDPNAFYDVEGSSVDLNFIDPSKMVIGQEYRGIQTLYSSKNGLVFGKLNLIYKGNNQVQILNDTYDFNLEFSNPLKFSEFISPRNIFTGIGQLYAGKGTSFTFRFKGLTTIHYTPPSSYQKF